MNEVEIIDFGYPQNSETDTLKTYITTESIRASPAAVVRAYHIQLALRCNVSRRRNHQRSRRKRLVL